MSGGRHWTVTWRAVAADGTSPDKWGAIAVFGDITTPAQAIHLVQTQRQRQLREKLPGRAFVDWKAVKRER